MILSGPFCLIFDDECIEKSIQCSKQEGYRIKSGYKRHDVSMNRLLFRHYENCDEIWHCYQNCCENKILVRYKIRRHHHNDVENFSHAIRLRGNSMILKNIEKVMGLQQSAKNYGNHKEKWNRSYKLWFGVYIKEFCFNSMVFEI